MKTGAEHLWQRASYQSILRRLDARAVLEYYGARNCTEQLASDGTVEIIHSCLLDKVSPHHSNGDNSPSAACNVDKKQYVCYSLGYGCDLFHLVNRLEGKEGFDDPLMTMGRFLTGATLEASDFAAELDKIFSAPNLLYTTDLPHFDDKILQSFDHSHPYWESRGITPEAQKILHLGYDPKDHRVVFPLIIQCKLAGWQKRVIPNETYPPYPKYKSSFNYPKSMALYNYDEASQYSSVIVVESPASVAKAVSYGLPNVVATMGAKVGKRQIQLLYPFETVYLWFDLDDAGREGERKVADALYHHTQVKIVTPTAGQDMGDATPEEIAAKIASAVPAALRLGELDLSGRMR